MRLRAGIGDPPRVTTARQWVGRSIEREVSQSDGHWRVRLSGGRAWRSCNDLEWLEHAFGDVWDTVGAGDEANDDVHPGLKIQGDFLAVRARVKGASAARKRHEGQGRALALLKRTRELVERDASVELQQLSVMCFFAYVAHDQRHLARSQRVRQCVAVLGCVKVDDSATRDRTRRSKCAGEQGDAASGESCGPGPRSQDWQRRSSQRPRGCWRATATAPWAC